ALDVAHRQRQLVFRLDVDEQHFSCALSAVDPEALQHRRRRLRLDLADGQRIDHGDCAVAQLLRKRRPQRTLLDLARQLVLVAARLRSEHGAALPPEWIANLTDARAARALLAPRLLARAADERTILRGVRAPPGRRIRAHDRL